MTQEYMKVNHLSLVSLKSTLFKSFQKNFVKLYLGLYIQSIAILLLSFNDNRNENIVVSFSPKLERFPQNTAGCGETKIPQPKMIFK